MKGPSSELLELLDAMSKAATETRAMQPAGRPCLRRCAWRATSWPWWAKRRRHFVDAGRLGA